ncbi:hypothetical protein SAMN05444166_6099 [Singulisphaera sp. GP187]|nr:hypothetical protein SAMN05444166_6099 [Singulisphaera sp. GP187]
MKFKKIPTVVELATFLREGRVQLPPLSLEWEEIYPSQRRET